MFKKFISTTALILCSLMGAATAQNYYQTITPQVDPIFDPNKIEVVEIFSYACPACNTFEPFFAAWADTQKDVADVDVISLAAPGQGVWTLYAQVFYTLEAMNELEKGHQAFFDAIHKDRKRFTNEKQIAKFMATQEIDEDRFLKAWNGFSAKSSFNRAENLIQHQYRVPFTPAIVIDGQYLLSAQDAANRPGPGSPYDKLIDSMNEVIEKVRSERVQK